MRRDRFRLRSRAGRRAQRALLSLPAWIAGVFIAAALPLMILLGFWAPGQRSLPLIAVAALFGVAIAIKGLDLAVAAPLRRLGGAIDLWRGGDAFELRQLGRQPREFRSVALSFRRSTLALARRERELKEALQQEHLAMQEIHHRVKNNLQIVASLLNLQASRIRQPEARAEFQSARDRVRALATVHRHLYAHGELNTINMRSFLADLCGPLFQAMGEMPDDRIALEIDAPELRMSSDQAVPLALIVTEIVTNAIKFGFPDGRTGIVSIRLAQIGDEVELDVSDDGVGLPEQRGEAPGGTRRGIGLQLVRGFARQLGATLTVSDSEGTRYVLRMRLRDDRPRPLLSDVLASG